eukprot:14891170-Alexandrium_andersonii.AAC.1
MTKGLGHQRERLVARCCRCRRARPGQASPHAGWQADLHAPWAVRARGPGDRGERCARWWAGGGRGVRLWRVGPGAGVRPELPALGPSAPGHSCRAPSPLRPLPREVLDLVAVGARLAGGEARNHPLRASLEPPDEAAEPEPEEGEEDAAAEELPTPVADQPREAM